MDTTALWMRHGTCLDGLRRPTAHARPNSPLTGAGADEAELTARELRKRNCRPAIIASSPLRRARQTATLVAATLSAHLIEPMSAFAEWQAPHCVLGRIPDEYPPDYVTWRQQRAQNPDSSLPGGESLQTFAERARDVATIVRELTINNGPVLIVSHRLLIGAVAALHAGYGDGKAPHLVAALVHKIGTVIGQNAVDDKTNEIPTVRDLLRRMVTAGIDLAGAVITVDAMHTQTETARLIRTLGADLRDVRQKSCHMAR
jgi:2,3-bisphosphoglycerate-dependent phosphoglycerate mutase